MPGYPPACRYPCGRGVDEEPPEAASRVPRGDAGQDDGGRRRPRREDGVPRDGDGRHGRVLRAAAGWTRAASRPGVVASQRARRGRVAAGEQRHRGDVGDGRAVGAQGRPHDGRLGVAGVDGTRRARLQPAAVHDGAVGGGAERRRGGGGRDGAPPERGGGAVRGDPRGPPAGRPLQGGRRGGRQREDDARVGRAPPRGGETEPTDDARRVGATARTDARALRRATPPRRRVRRRQRPARLAAAAALDDVRTRRPRRRDVREAGARRLPAGDQRAAAPEAGGRRARLHAGEVPAGQDVPRRRRRADVHRGREEGAAETRE